MAVRSQIKQYLSPYTPGINTLIATTWAGVSSDLANDHAPVWQVVSKVSPYIARAYLLPLPALGTNRHPGPPTLAVGLGSLFTVTDLACAFGVKPQCYGSERWLPSQKGLLRVCLQAHQATGLASVRSTWRGSKPVPLWEPSQKG